MIEVRVNSGCPTGAVSGAPAEDAALPPVSCRGGGGAGQGVRSTTAAGPTEVVSVRMHRGGMAALSLVQRQLGGSKSDVLRQAVEIVAAVLADSASIDAAAKSLPKLLAARRPVVSEVEEGVLVDVRDMLRAVAEQYSRQAFQFQKIGNNWNQITKVANSGAPVDADAMRGVARALERVAQAMERDAQRDAKLAAKLQEVH